MAVNRAFLKPRSVDKPPQGDFEYIPIMLVVESDSAAGLEDELNIGTTTQAQDTTAYYVVESVQYSTTVLQQAVGMNPAVVKCSALIWITRALKV